MKYYITWIWQLPTCKQNQVLFTVKEISIILLLAFFEYKLSILIFIWKYFITERQQKKWNEQGSEKKCNKFLTFSSRCNGSKRKKKFKICCENFFFSLQQVSPSFKCFLLNLPCKLLLMLAVKLHLDFFISGFFPLVGFFIINYIILLKKLLFFSFIVGSAFDA